MQLRKLPNDGPSKGERVIEMTTKDQAIKLLKLAAEYLCADEPEQGDYCICGAYVGAGESHKKGCFYSDVQRFLKKVAKK